MRHMAFNDSDILRDFGRLMQEKDELKKTAQALPPPTHAPGTTVPNAAPVPTGAKPMMWEKLYAELEAARGDGKALEAVQRNMQTLNYAANEQGFYDDMLQKLQTYMTPEALAFDAKAKHKTPQMPRRAALSQHEKTADQKVYDVTPKEDMVQEAHPQSAKVNGDTVENLNEQQKADLEVARKSAQIKKILASLYKLAKRLQAEKQEQAYQLVKETFLELSQTFRK